MPTLLITDPLYTKHLTGPGHPESPQRATAILEALQPLDLEIASPRDATEEEILLCHSPEYLKIVKEDVLYGSGCLRTGDAPICPESYAVALRAVGGVLTAVDSVMEGKYTNAFCLIRPPGHHAESYRGMGFCIFNNAAIGARYAQQKYGIKRVLIVDWDVHHGNGTQEIFYNDPSVFYFSTHQFPLYPGTGAERETGAGTILNCPIPGGWCARNAVLGAFDTKLVPAMEAFQPELVIISAGFDAHADDPLGGMDLRTEDFRELTKIVKEIAANSAEGRIVSVLEGGYNLTALAASAKAHVEELNSEG